MDLGSWFNIFGEIVKYLNANWTTIVGAVRDVAGALVVLYGVALAVWEIIKKGIGFVASVRADIQILTAKKK